MIQTLSIETLPIGDSVVKTQKVDPINNEKKEDEEEECIEIDKQVEIHVDKDAMASYTAGDYNIRFLEELFNMSEPEIMGDLSYIDIVGDLYQCGPEPVKNRPDERAEELEHFKPAPLSEGGPYESTLAPSTLRYHVKHKYYSMFTA